MRKPRPSPVASDGTGQGGRTGARLGSHRVGDVSVSGMAFTVRASALAMNVRNAFHGRPRAADQGGARLTCRTPEAARGDADADRT
jgi:hypothetical protein